MVEVQIRLQKAFAALARNGDPRYITYARLHSAQALLRAEAAMPFSFDIDRVRRAAAQVAD
jgi:hypothetical protein